MPPSPAQAPRIQVMQRPPNLSPKVNIIPPPETTNNTETNIDEPISHRTRSRRTTPDTPIQWDHEAVTRRTRSQINPKGLAQQVKIIHRQASQRRFPRSFIHKWDMTIMDKVTGKKLEHCQLRRHPKYKKTWN